MRYNVKDVDIAWCPGCGNYSIHNILKKALEELDIAPVNLVLVSGIGQAAKAPQYLRCNYFNGLHGRSLPVATAIKVCNPQLTVIVESGDGCMYGEGGNHFIHAIRRNPDITVLVHNNMVYGLTKGQASPTSQRGFMTPVQPFGSLLEPFNPIAVAIALRASFVARAFCGDFEQTKEIIKVAIKHKGFALVDIFQPCVTFNKLNTYEWFKKNTYYLVDHDPKNIVKAFEKAMQKEPYPLGIFYIEEKPTFEELQPVYTKSSKPIVFRKHIKEEILGFIERKRR
ncbi:thiamine pyrophosphate-dependent enzyme [Pseudothermotoga thermarum]|uniref:Pyruvate ferredoxin/flavodoxin oxidoreductase, beta subunit n=1 Tax=Pseudothermotoga thermarum DSM 5069 TaxID=688269 RepID=F7YUN8_9THEM|nr:thiamine pyrophosphate-dependent enzyme [Pseudothermotoga thermarum]AEH50223.1 pyruvate ferredoxin/flavodoxin oxidoreductase, beta subunit [Pseudothermotoga thermarum DSM 5069]